jgi:FdhD protein
MVTPEDVRVAARPIIRVADGVWNPADDLLAMEDPLEIRLGSTAIAVVMRTPGHDHDLVRGFALTEGIVLHPREIANVRELGEGADGGRVEVVLADGVEVDPEQFRRNLYATSSCGVCGKASIDAVRISARPAPPGPEIEPQVLYDVAEAMRSAQAGFDASGGVHAAAAFEPDGTLISVREDIGRHNAVDKVVGDLSTRRWPFGTMGLMVSGRVSFEMIQKAAVAGFPLVAGVSAASSLAIDLAEELGMTAIGFVRDGGCNIYTDRGRLVP